MSREDFVAIAVRLFSIYVLFTILRSLPGAAQFLSGPNGATWTALYAVVLVAGVLLCTLLWFFPLSVARKLLPVMREPRSEQTLSAPLALTIGLTLIGVWMLAYGLSDASYWAIFIIRSNQATQSVNVPMEWTADQIANIVATGIQLALSLWLILGNAGIRRLIYKFRYGET